MTTRDFLTSAWNWNPWAIASAIIVLAIYLQGHGHRCKLGWMLAGLFLFLMTFCSPLYVLAGGYLFSAHMLQHLLLLLVVPALMLLSFPCYPCENSPRRFSRISAPPSPSSRMSPWSFFPRIHPALSWLLGVGGMWLWHIPALCNAVVTHQAVYVLQIVSLLLMGVLFWRPILGPAGRQRLHPLLGVLYLFSACLACTLLGILITFAPFEVCSIYHHPVDRLGILPLLRETWGLTPEKDQQIGGLLMWVPACLIYFCGILGLLYRWYRSPGVALDSEGTSYV